MFVTSDAAMCAGTCINLVTHRKSSAGRVFDITYYYSDTKNQGGGYITYVDMLNKNNKYI